MFQKAERTLAFAKIAVTGPSGSGKTLASLLIAKGLGGRTALLDSENNSASLYADHPLLGGWEFDVATVRPPFTTEKYNAAVEQAVLNGYTNIILDSISHSWEGEGGLKDQKDVLDTRPNANHWTNWRPITTKHEKFKASILQSQINVICTMRSKTEYMQVETNGKKSIKKLGLAPIQRDGIEYEFTVVFDIGSDHLAEVSKTRTNIFDGQGAFQITAETGERILTWLKGAKKAPVVEPLSPVDEIIPFVEPDPEDIGGYIVPVGRKYKGMRLDQVGENDLDGFVDWYKKQLKENRRDPNAMELEFFEAAEAYLKSKEFERK